MIAVRRVATLAGVAAAAALLSACAQLETQWDKVVTPDVAATRHTDGAVATAGAENVHTLRVGDCLPKDVNGEVATVAVVPCRQQHASEVFARVTLDDPAYPDDDTMNAHTWAACEELFEPYVGAAYGTSAFTLSALAPSRESWDQGDTSVVCLLHPASGEPSTGSARQSGS